jgi:hypothetical protein
VDTVDKSRYRLPMAFANHNYLTPAQTATELGMKDAHGVYKLIKRGKLPAIRVSEGRWAVARWALDAYKDRLAGRGPDLHFAVTPPEEIAARRERFKEETGLTPDTWVRRWKANQIEDNAENEDLLMKALQLRKSRTPHRARRLAAAGRP